MPYSLCDTGKEQSPINLADGYGEGSAKVKLNIGDKYKDYESI